MIQVPYPTMERNFVVPPSELDLPLGNPEQQNNHHLYWTFRRMGEFLITKTFRDLQHNQQLMPVNTHTALHQRYSPPTKLPSLDDMVEQIEMARLTGEPLQVQENRKGKYFHHQISEIALKQVHMEYNRLNDNKRVA